MTKKKLSNNCHLQAELFEPQLHKEKVEVINALRMGTVNKIFLEFESPFWEMENPGPLVIKPFLTLYYFSSQIDLSDSPRQALFTLFT